MSEPGAPTTGGEGHYFRQFDLFRVVAFLAVIAQHSVLWDVPGGSRSGWSIVMVLHATRNVFFFLAVLLATLSQYRSPRSVVGLWVRRIGIVLVPYLIWTVVYYAYTALVASGPLSRTSTFIDDLFRGYYQLYFLVVLFQVFLVLPALLWLVRRTRGHHWMLFSASLLAQLVMTTLSHYFVWQTGPLHLLRAADLFLLTSRHFTGYQLYLVAGALAADHFGEVQRFVERHSGAILWVTAAIAAATEGYYAFGLTLHQTPGQASDLYQPVATIWFLAACGGLWALGWRWAQRSSLRRGRLRDRVITWAADASGGFYLAHILMLRIVFSVLTHHGLTQPSTWKVGSLITYVGTVFLTGVLVWILLRTPLRGVLTGPVRSRQRAKLAPYPTPPARRSSERPVVADVGS